MFKNILQAFQPGIGAAAVVETAAQIQALRGDIGMVDTEDDAAETVLLQLARGSGLKGAAGIPDMRRLIYAHSRGGVSAAAAMPCPCHAG